MYKKKEKTPTKIIVVPHFIGTEKDIKIFKEIVEEYVFAGYFQKGQVCTVYPSKS